MDKHEKEKNDFVLDIDKDNDIDKYIVDGGIENYIANNDIENKKGNLPVKSEGKKNKKGIKKEFWVYSELLWQYL
ncbi:hypothetical protein ACJDU8_16935 [Clostridium sp. WILCCON 0269]|uniref:Uncharacterized protein n=1 Tax=Candidatus Clostridium eludens TaxID=3381663 RepID=A0ABW8SPY2_9CLOT